VLSSGMLKVKPLISHRFAVEEAEAATTPSQPTRLPTPRCAADLRHACRSAAAKSAASRSGPEQPGGVRLGLSAPATLQTHLLRNSWRQRHHV